jgi:hypothetical protein
MLTLISAVGIGDEKQIEDVLEVLACEFGLSGYFGAVVGVPVAASLDS